MATQTTGNLKLSKPDGTDKVKEFRAPYNSNLDKIDEAVSAQSAELGALGQRVDGVQDGLAIVSNGNTHAAIAQDQFVYVKNHSALSEGLYRATAAIPANDALSTSNLTADESGGLNALNSKMIQLISIPLSGTTDSSGDVEIVGITEDDYPIAFLAGANSSDIVTFFDGSQRSGYQLYAHFATKKSTAVSGIVVCIRGTIQQNI